MLDLMQKFSQDLEINPMVDGFVMPISGLNDLTGEEMSKPEIIAKIVDLVLDTRFNNDRGDGNEIYLKLSKKLEDPNLKEDPEIFKQYSTILQYLTWFTFALRNDKEVGELIKNNLLFGFKSNIDISGVVTDRLMFFSNDIANGNERKVILDALRENSEKLGQEDIVIKETEQKQAPQIKNWLLDYDRTIEKPQGKGNVEQITYVNQNENARKLKQADKDILLKILKIYDLLRYTPVIPGAYQEAYSVGRISKESAVAPVKVKKEPLVLEKEVPMPKPRVAPAKPEPVVTTAAKPATPPPAENLPERFKKFLAGPLAVKAFAKQEALQKQTNKDLKALRNQFYHLVNDKDAEGAMAALLALAENKQLRQAFAEDDRFVKFWGDYLDKLALTPSPSPTKQERGVKDLINQFKNDPAAGKHLAMFFKYILEKRLGLNKKDAVMFGAVIGNLARQAGELEYQDIVYGDESDGKFKWNT